MCILVLLMLVVLVGADADVQTTEIGIDFFGWLS